MREKIVIQKSRLALTLAVGCGVACCLLMTGCISSGLLRTGLSQEELVDVASAAQVDRGTPEGVTVMQNGLRCAMVSWSAPTDKVYRYRIERADAAEGPFAAVADVSPSKLIYTDGATPATRLKDSATYYYRLMAVIEKGGPVSPLSSVVKTTTAPPPVPPLEVKAVATGSRAVTVTWATSASDGVTSYRVERTLAAEPGAFEKVADVHDLRCVDGGTPASTLKDSTKYLYRVVSINRVDAESAPSAASEVLTFPPPKPVHGLAAVSREVRCVPLTWEASPEPDVVRYDIYRGRASEGPFQKIGGVLGRSVNQSIDGGGNPGDLEDDGTYFYRVRAVNSVTAESADSEVVRAVTREVPPEVQQVAAVSGKPREIPVSWAISADTAVVGYELWRAAGDEENWSQVVRLNGRDVTSYLDRGGEKDGTKLGHLKDGSDYLYKVIAFNTADVRSSASIPVKAKTKYSPVAPVGLSATTNLAGTVRLTWQPNPEKDVSGYWVESSRKATGGFRKLTVAHVSEGATLAAEELELDPSVIKYYRIKALDKEGLESLWSEVIQGRTKPLPEAPSGLQAKTEGGLIRITWQAPSQADVKQYKIWFKKMFGWDLLATTEQPEYRLDLTDMPKAMVLAVTAVDQDKLESARSEPVKVEPKVQ